MQDVVVILALLLGGIIVTHEYFRVRRRSQVDFLMGVSFLYFICYCVVPIYIQTLQDTDLGFWNWIFRLSFGAREYALASILSIAGYMAIVAGYHAADFKAAQHFGARFKSWIIPETFKIITAAAFGMLGVLSLFIYANEVGGFAIMVQAVGFFRNQTEAYSDLGFFIKIAPFTSLSSYLFWDLVTSTNRTVRKTAFSIGFVLTFVSSLLILYSMGGRVQFVFYLMTFVLYASFRRGQLPLPHVLAATAAFMFVILFGKEIINYNVYVSDDLIGTAWEDISADPFVGIRKLLVEFVFPYVSLSYLVEMVPDSLSYRWFIDIPLGVAYLLPKPLLGLNLPPTITMIYDDVLDVPIPIDLLSFGYTSFGVIGSILVCLAFGALVCVADAFFPPNELRILALLRAAWLLYLSAQVMYGTPQHALVAGFPLLVGTCVIMACGKRLTYHQVSREQCPSEGQFLGSIR